MPPFQTSQGNNNSLASASVGTSLLKNPGPQDQISVELNALHEADEYLLDRVQLLRNRLSPVLLDTSEKSAVGGATPQPAMSPVAASIRHERTRVDTAIYMLNGILSDLSL